MLLLFFILGFGLSWEYKSPRSLAMGGVGVALKDTQTSFFLNPAGLYGTKSLDIIPIEFYISDSIIFDLKKIDAVISSVGGENFSVSDVKDLFGRGYGSKIFVFPNFSITLKKVSFGLGILAGTGIGFKSALPSNFVLNDTFLFTGVLPVLGGAISFLDDSLRMGISVVPIELSATAKIEVRENELLYFDTLFPAFTRGLKNISDILNNSCRYPLECAFGFGGFNFGLIWNPVWLKDFGVGIAIRDIADPVRKTTGDFGISYGSRVYQVNYSFFLDFQDILFTQSPDFLYHLFFGSEVSFDIPGFKRFFSFMFGVGQLNLSAGFELNLKVLSLTVGTFAEELRGSVGTSRLRYYFFKLAI